MNLADLNEIHRLLSSEGFSFKKSLGQNFIIDSTVCPAMAQSACDDKTGVIEIGPGAGVLTAELAKRARRVVAIELDERLKGILGKTVGAYDNVKIIFADVMKIDLRAVIEENFSDCERVEVCANLPYYITSPIIMMLLESRLPITGITAMVQKEAAQRLCAKVGTRAAGAVTAAVSYYSEPQILFDVGRHSFVPPPKVDSAVIRLTIRHKPPIELKSEKQFFNLVKACFAQRRKTLLNTVSSTMGVDKQYLRECLEKMELSATVRGEELTIEQLAILSDFIYEK